MTNLKIICIFLLILILNSSSYRISVNTVYGGTELYHYTAVLICTKNYTCTDIECHEPSKKHICSPYRLEKINENRIIVRTHSNSLWSAECLLN